MAMSDIGALIAQGIELLTSNLAVDSSRIPMVRIATDLI